MKAQLIKILLLLVVVAIVYYFLLRQADHKQGKKAPGFEAELINGQKFNLSELRGDYVLLDFWGSWCPPCRKENPQLVSLYKSFNNKKSQNNEGFKVVSIALEKNDKSWRDAANRAGFTWPHQIVQLSKVVILSPLAQKYAVKSIPAKFLIDPEGTILMVNPSIDEIDDFLSKTLINI